METWSEAYTRLSVVAVIREHFDLASLLQSHVNGEPGKPGAVGGSTSVSALSSIQTLNRLEESFQVPQMLSMFLNAVSSLSVCSGSDAQKSAIFCRSGCCRRLVYVSIVS